ncbi:MAG: hypothetical protein HKN32_06760 [Flavobacteriales bacterium]|nr:hypothetical protein [Flavobacteriales bacterium]
MKGYLTGLFCLICCSFFAQDVILTMGGRQIQCVIVDDLGIDIRYEIEKKNGKKRDLRMHRSEIFSITKSGEEELVYYTQDEVLGDWLTVDDMRIFIAGEQDARENYEVQWIVWTGAAAGAIGAYASQGGLMGTLAAPVGFTALQLLPNIRIKEETMSNIRYQYNDVYALGYERVARSKRVVAALKSSGIGMVVGVVSWLIFPIER